MKKKILLIIFLVGTFLAIPSQVLAQQGTAMSKTKQINPAVNKLKLNPKLKLIPSLKPKLKPKSRSNLKLSPVGVSAKKIFMKIGGMRGESTDESHKEWIDVKNIFIKKKNAHIETIVITKYLDSSTHKFSTHASNGKHIPSIKIETIQKINGRVVIKKAKLLDSLISKVLSAGVNSENKRPMEKVYIAVGDMKGSL